MGWSVVAENGSYNWTPVINNLSSGSNAGDNTEHELSQHYV
jgi:hypothetical protein